jgi:hypothetical protein
LALIALIPVGVAAASDGTTLALDCSGAHYEPGQLMFGACDGMKQFKRLRWSSWTTSSAVARGVYVVRGKKRTRSYAVRLTLSGPLNCPQEPNPVFAHIGIVYLRSHP